MKTSNKFKLNASLAAIVLSFGSSVAIAQVTTGSGTVNGIAGTPAPGTAQAVTIGFTPSPASTTSLTGGTAATGVVVPTTGALATTGPNLVAPPASGVIRTFVASSPYQLQTTATSANTAGSVLGYNGNATLTAGSVTTTQTISNFRVITISDSGGGGPVAVSTAYGFVNSAGVLDLATLRNAPLDTSAEAGEYASNTGTYTGAGTVIPATVSTSNPAVSGGSLNVGGNAVVSGTLSVTGATTLGALSATSFATTGPITAPTFIGNLTGNVAGSLSGTSVSVATVSATLGNIATVNASAVNAGTVTATVGNIATVNSAIGNISTVNAAVGNIAAVNATTVSATTGNIANVNATTVGASIGNIATVNATNVNATNTVSAATISATNGNFATISTTGNATIGGTFTAGSFNATNINSTGAITAGSLTVTGATIVRNAVNANEAVNLGQLRSEINSLDKRASGGIASAVAMANMPNVEVGKDVAVGVGLGSYNGQTSFAIGASTRVAGAVVKGSVGGGSGSKTAVGVGASFSF